VFWHHGQLDVLMSCRINRVHFSGVISCVHTV